MGPPSSTKGDNGDNSSKNSNDGGNNDSEALSLRFSKKTSEVWKYFEPLTAPGDSNPRSKCTLCQNIFKCPGGSTTGMRGHLERKHPGIGSFSVTPTGSKRKSIAEVQEKKGDGRNTNTAVNSVTKANSESKGSGGSIANPELSNSANSGAASSGANNTPKSSNASTNQSTTAISVNGASNTSPATPGKSSVNSGSYTDNSSTGTSTRSSRKRIKMEPVVKVEVEEDPDLTLEDQEGSLDSGDGENSVGPAAKKRRKMKPKNSKLEEEPVSNPPEDSKISDDEEGVEEEAQEEEEDEEEEEEEDDLEEIEEGEDEKEENQDTVTIENELGKRTVSTSLADLTASLAFMCCADLKPLCTINNIGFQAVLSNIDQKSYAELGKGLDSEQPFSVPFYIKQMFDQEKTVVRCSLRNKFFTLSYWVWKRNAKESYVVLDANYIQEDTWRWTRMPIGIHELPPRGFKLPQGNGAGSYESYAARQALEQEDVCKWTQVNCTVFHGPVKGNKQSIRGEQVFPCFTTFIDRLFEHVWSSMSEAAGLDCKMEIERIAHLVLENYDELKYNTASLIHALKLADLSRVNIDPRLPDIDILCHWCKILNPIYEVVDIMLEEKRIHISTILPIMYALRDEAETLSVSTLDLGDERFNSGILKSLICQAAKETYGIDFKSPHIAESNLGVATFLDPRYKSLRFLSHNQRAGVIVQLQKDIITSHPMASEATLRDRGNVWKPECPVSILTMRKLKVKLDREIKVYNHANVPNIDMSPYEWWKQNSPKFPTLSRVAQKYLQIPAVVINPLYLYSSAGLKFDSSLKELERNHFKKVFFLHMSYTNEDGVLPSTGNDPQAADEDEDDEDEDEDDDEDDEEDDEMDESEEMQGVEGDEEDIEEEEIGDEEEDMQEDREEIARRRRAATLEDAGTETDDTSIGDSDRSKETVCKASTATETETQGGPIEETKEALEADEATSKSSGQGSAENEGPEREKRKLRGGRKPPKILISGSESSSECESERGSKDKEVDESDINEGAESVTEEATEPAGMSSTDMKEKRGPDAKNKKDGKGKSVVNASETDEMDSSTAKAKGMINEKESSDLEEHEDDGHSSTATEASSSNVKESISVETRRKPNDNANKKDGEAGNELRSESRRKDVAKEKSSSERDNKKASVPDAKGKGGGDSKSSVERKKESVTKQLNTVQLSSNDSYDVDDDDEEDILDDVVEESEMLRKVKTAEELARRKAEIASALVNGADEESDGEGPELPDIEDIEDDDEETEEELPRRGSGRFRRVKDNRVRDKSEKNERYKSSVIDIEDDLDDDDDDDDELEDVGGEDDSNTEDSLEELSVC